MILWTLLEPSFQALSSVSFWNAVCLTCLRRNFGTAQDQKGGQQSSHRLAQPAHAASRVILHESRGPAQTDTDLVRPGHTVLHHCKFNGSETTLNTSLLCCRLPGVYLDPATLRTLSLHGNTLYFAIAIIFWFYDKVHDIYCFLLVFLKSYCINNWDFSFWDKMQSSDMGSYLKIEFPRA